MKQPTHVIDAVASCAVNGRMPVRFNVADGQLTATTTVPCVQAGGRH